MSLGEFTPTKDNTLRIRGSVLPIPPETTVVLSGVQRLIILEALAGLMARCAVPEDVTSIMRTAQHLEGLR